jgi:hypothetical protein
MNYQYTSAPMSPAGEQQAPRIEFNVAPELNQKMFQMMITQQGAIARTQQCQIFMNLLAEIRMALNLPKVSESDSGIGDRAKLEPMFGEDHLNEIRLAYLETLNRLMQYQKHTLDMLIPKPKKDETTE